MILGHSSNEQGIRQLYKDHIINVIKRALSFFDDIRPYFNKTEKEWNCLRNALFLACLYHDLGKLDDLSQKIMYNDHKEGSESFGDEIQHTGKMLNHVDAGTAYLIKIFNQSISSSNPKIEYLYAAILINAHHTGLLNDENLNFDIFVRNNASIRDKKRVIDRNHNYLSLLSDVDETTMSYVDRHLDQWIKLHNQEVGKIEDLRDSSFFDAKKFPLSLRILLSCLAEGDHYDTANHYGKAVEITPQPLRAKERLEYQIEKRKDFKQGKTQAEQKRNKIRNAIFDDCLQSNISNSIFHISATPGNGKTQGGDCLSKRIAILNNLRRIYKVSPFSNIIIQNVKEIKKYNVLPGEVEDEVVGEHHHQSDYLSKANISNMAYRKAKELNTLWKCPIEFTSSVQFFETMASNWPSKLRKFNMVPGSVIEIDEYHTCLPLTKIRQTFLWMKELIDVWSCKFVFMSGSPIEFWSINDLNSCEINKEEVCEVLSDKTKKMMEEFEKDRVNFVSIKEPLSVLELIERVVREHGPRIVVCNTVLTAAYVANHFRIIMGRKKVMHISTALSPHDREIIYGKIKKRLKNKEDKDWVLVATSCVDTGVNFSFATGFREANSLMSALQLGGRVNRDGEMGRTCNVFMFKLKHFDEGTTNNPAFYPAITVLDRMLDCGKVNYYNCSEAIDREVQERNSNLREIEEFERMLNFYEVSKRYKLINAIYETVIVNDKIIEKMLSDEFVHPKEIIKHSVQIYLTKLDREEFSRSIETYDYSKELIEQFKESKINKNHYKDGYHLWAVDYCPDFLGYMKAILKLAGEDVDY